jgi:hypothetical protein
MDVTTLVFTSFFLVLRSLFPRLPTLPPLVRFLFLTLPFVPVTFRPRFSRPLSFQELHCSHFPLFSPSLVEPYDSFPDTFVLKERRNFPYWNLLSLLRLGENDLQRRAWFAN